MYNKMKLNFLRRTKKFVIPLEHHPFETSFKLNHVLALDFMRDTL